MSLPGQKNTNADSISLQPPKEIVIEFVVVVFLCEGLRAYHRMLTEFPMRMFQFKKINPLSPQLLLFGLNFMEEPIPGFII